MKPENRHDAYAGDHVSYHHWVKPDEIRVTYNPPSAKTPTKQYFCRLGICRLLKTEIGMAITIKSVMMLKLELQYQNTMRFMQCPPSIVLSQKYATGIHEQIEAIETARPWVHTSARRTKHNFRTLGSTMNRRS